MAATNEDFANQALISFAREARFQIRPDDPIGSKLAGVLGEISSMGAEIRRLERENQDLKEKIERLTNGARR